MISLVIPPKGQINLTAKMLADELGTASNIKSRVNRQSVLAAIGSAQQRLKLYNHVPPNGLVIYCGTVLTDNNKEKKVTIDFEPFKPINTSLYLCDNKFHTEALAELATDGRLAPKVQRAALVALIAAPSPDVRPLLAPEAGPVSARGPQKKPTSTAACVR